VTAEICESVDKIVMYLLPRGRLTDDERLLNQIAPGQLFARSKRMVFLQYRKDLLRPKMYPVTVGPFAHTRQKGHVETELSDCGYVFLGIAVDQFDPDTRVVLAVVSQQLSQKAGSDGGKDADLDASALGATQSSDVLCAFSKISDNLAR